MKQTIWTLALLLTGLSTLSAQVKETKYWVFPLDSIKHIHFELADAYEIEHWAGNQVMINAEITLYGASKGVLTHFMEESDRYEIQDTVQQDELLIFSAMAERPAIKIGGKSCFEQTAVKVLIPENFEKASDHTWIWREEEEGQ